jgi:hypothetical protein
MNIIRFVGIIENRSIDVMVILIVGYKHRNDNGGSL